MARLDPWQMKVTAGDDGPIIGRIWGMPEPALIDLLRRAKAGEDPDDLMFELIMTWESRDA